MRARMIGGAGAALAVLLACGPALAQECESTPVMGPSVITFSTPISAKNVPAGIGSVHAECQVTFAVIKTPGQTTKCWAKIQGQLAPLSNGAWSGATQNVLHYNSMSYRPLSYTCYLDDSLGSVTGNIENVDASMAAPGDVVSVSGTFAQPVTAHTDPARVPTSPALQGAVRP